MGGMGRSRNGVMPNLRARIRFVFPLQTNLDWATLGAVPNLRHCLGRPLWQCTYQVRAGHLRARRHLRSVRLLSMLQTRRV